ncbi:YiiD C-terminal domain-containing protein [Sulfurimonas sp.]
MQAGDIPFVKLLDIQESDSIAFLEYKEDVLNHVNTIHASAQFTLAETQSGIYLQKLFPELDGKVVPLLRDAKIKYKKPAQKSIEAVASVDDEIVLKFREQFEKKGRGSIVVNVSLYDINELLIANATFTWFVAKI